MSLFSRLRYAAALAVAVAMAVGIVGSIAGRNVVEILSNPWFVIFLYGAAFVLAPWIERLFPYKQKED